VRRVVRLVPRSVLTISVLALLEGVNARSILSAESSTASAAMPVDVAFARKGIAPDFRLLPNGVLWWSSGAKHSAVW
jgi:hypothetical protein